VKTKEKTRKVEPTTSQKWIMIRKSKPQTDPTKIIQKPTLLEVPIGMIFPISDNINGGLEATRWGKPPVVAAIAQKLVHRESFIKHGLLLPFPVVKLPSDYRAILDGKAHTYKKGEYVTIDFNGRLRTGKEMTDEGYSWGELKGNLVPIADVTDQVLNGKDAIDDDVIEVMYDAVIVMSTGELKWDIYQFINSGAGVITDPIQSTVWNYISHAMQESRNKKVSNRNVLFATLGGIPSEHELRTKTLDYDMEFSRYSDLILRNFARVRKDWTIKQLPGPTLDVFGKLFRDAAKDGEFATEIPGTNSKGITTGVRGPVRFKLEDGNGEKLKLYTDEHYVEFEKWTVAICDMLCSLNPPVDPITKQYKYPANRAAARIAFGTVVEGCYKSTINGKNN